MRVTWQAVTHSITTLRTALFTIALSASLLFPIFYNPGIVHADSVVQYGTAWLGGGGVDIMTGGDGSHNCVSVSGAPAQSQCGNVAGKVYAGDKWQCVEMVNRLYLSKGWTTTTWWGNGSSLINDLPNHPGLTDQLQDHISYVNPGDVVTEIHSTDGHAGVVNNIDADGTIHIKSQNADLDSQASITSGSLAAGSAHYALAGWVGYSIQAIIHPPKSTTPPLRIGALFTSGDYDVKESTLDGGWVTEYPSGVTQGLQDGTLTGIVMGGGLYGKQGNLTSGWVNQDTSGNVVQASISDAVGTTPIRIAKLLNNGNFYVKEGLTSTTWTLEQGGVVAGYVSGNWIAALLSDGTFEVKDGLNGGWVVENGSVSQGIISGDGSTGLIGVVIGGTLLVKQGQYGSWVTEQGGVANAQLSKATSQAALSIGYIDTSGTFSVKAGLYGGWVTEQGGVSQAALSGNLIGAVLTDGTYQVKQGQFGGWVTEQGGVAKPALWSPN